MADVEREQDEAVSQMPKKSSAVLGLLLGLGFLLAASGCLYLGTVGSADARVQSADYHRAPGCTPSGAASSGLPPCTFQAMKVTSKNQIDGGEDAPDIYKLGLSRSGGTEQEVTLFGPEKADLFAHVAVGGAVQVKSWQGQILILTIPGWHCGTPDHPDAQVDSGNKSLFAGGFFVLIGGLTLFYSGRAYKNRDRVIEGTN